ncbi:MAG TPA: holo-ACP synthase [bacterium]|jgi:holo-[acyl-carrier protein] synthase
MPDQPGINVPDIAPKPGVPVSVGIDVVENARVSRMIEKFGDKFLSRCFTEREIHYCGAQTNSVTHYSARLAAKEAAYKALQGKRGMGLRWLDAEVVSSGINPPDLKLHGNAYKFAETSGVTSILMSLTHEENYSAAVVILVSNTLDSLSK